MKKTGLPLAIPLPAGFIKALLMMKFIFLLVLMACLQVSARVYSQNTRLTLRVEDARLNTLFKIIEKQTDYRFVYSNNILPANKTVSIDANNKPLSEILTLALANTELTYSPLESNLVIISLKKNAPEYETIKGSVTDKQGSPLPGVTVRNNRTKQGTVTDQQGNYSLQAAERDELSFSFIGYENKIVKAGTKGTLNIALEASSSKLNETVVVGYGTTKIKDMTGSVARINAKELEIAPTGGAVASFLQGKAAGVNVMVQSGAPGAPAQIIIRGGTSLSGTNEPLYVVDGVPNYVASNQGVGADVTKALFNLNLSDVETIDVLKDASATAIYGSRGANGVVIITTKKGRAGTKPEVELKYSTGVQARAGGWDVMNAANWQKIVEEAARNGVMTTGATDYFTKQLLDANSFATNGHIDFQTGKVVPGFFRDNDIPWWNMMTQDARQTQYDLSMRGGSANNNYYASISYLDQEGIVVNSNLKRISARFNTETKVGKNLKIGINMDGATSVNNQKNDLTKAIVGYRPDLPIYAADGSFFLFDQYTDNPISIANNKLVNNAKNFTGSGYAEYEIIPGLRFRSNYSVRYNLYNNDEYVNRGKSYSSSKGYGTIAYNESYTTLFDNTLTYAKAVDKHDLIAMVGTSVEQAKSKMLSAAGSDFPDDFILNNLGSATTFGKPNSNEYATGLTSGFVRVNYKYDRRFLATLTGRADGSSKFGSGNRFGYFPSGALAWIASEESFLKDNSMVNYLKVRASMGKTGTQDIGNDQWRTLMSGSVYEGLPGVYPFQLGNTKLKWETTTQFDAGIDYALWNNRISGALGVYQKNTNNLLYNTQVPSSSGFTKVTQNLATIQNKGIEFDVLVDLVKTRDWMWDFGFNVSKNWGKVVSVNGERTYLQKTVLEGGMALGTFYGHRALGIFKTMEEIDALSTIDPKTGKKVYYQNQYTRPGDLKFADLNGDGIVNNDDREVLGNSNPWFYGGINSTVRYKGFTLSARFDYSYGAKRFWVGESEMMSFNGYFNKVTDVMDRWTPENPNAKYPRVIFYDRSENNRFSDFYLHDASYLRLNNLNISYRVPQRLLQGYFIKGIDLSAYATNLFTITNYPGMDPQGNFNTSVSATMMGTGYDYSYYPSTKTYNCSVRFIFN
jgi:TonB-linked SusC/RagA family outer membrane protein